MQQGDAYCPGYRVGQFVHGVRTQNDNICAAAFDGSRGDRQYFSELVPLTAVLKLFNLGKIYGDHHAASVVMPSEASGGLFVYQSIVLS
jgi:hypothetical protein